MCSEKNTSTGSEHLFPREKITAGGAAAASGMNFQAAVTAIAMVHMIRGVALGWLDGIIDDTPIAVSAETGGPGDDIHIQTKAGAIIEAQIKRGLSAGDRLWQPLIDLARALAAGKISGGALIVCPNASQAISGLLARDIRRLGEGRRDALSSIGNVFLEKLTREGIDVGASCGALRIIRLNCISFDDASVKAARAELAHVCKSGNQVQEAWDRLYRDAHQLIESRGRRTVVACLRVLSSSGISIISDLSESPISQVSKLADWQISSGNKFSVVGAVSSLQLDDHWIKANVQVCSEEVVMQESLASAIAEYHGWYGRESSSRNGYLIEPDTLGFFYRYAVIIGGPGMGKSLLLKRLVRTYSQAMYPVLGVYLPALCARMKHQGKSFLESLLELGLDGSGVSIDIGLFDSITSWVLVCDSLDECGADQKLVADGLLKFVAGRQGCRVIIATRPVGYDRSLLNDWRHYELLPLNDSETDKNIATLIRGLCKAEDRAEEAIKFAREQISQNSAAKLVTRSPLLLSMIATLAAGSASIGTTKPRLYENFFNLIESASPRSRRSDELNKPTLNRFLQIVGWNIITEELAPTSDIIDRSAQVLKDELGYPYLKAQALASSCLLYWADVGLLEQVSHAGEATVTFIHRSFAEFAAASYLRNLPNEDRALEILNSLDQPQREDVLKFAASLGLINEIFDVCELGKVDQLKRILIIAAESTALLSSDRIELLVRCAFNHVVGERRSVALELGALLERLSSRYPEATAGVASRHTEDKKTWARLVSWACLLHSPDKLDGCDKLIAALFDLPRAAELESINKLGGFRAVGDHGDSLLSSFVVRGCEIVLERCAPELSDEVVPKILAPEHMHTLGFYERIEPVLKRFGKNLERAGISFVSSIAADFVGGDDFNAAWKGFFHKVATVLANATGDVSPIASQQLLAHLGAFFGLTSIWDMSASNVWVWQRPYDPEAIKEALLAVVQCSPLSSEDVSRDACRMLAMFEASVRPAFFDLIPKVDAPSINYAKARELKVNASKLEAALYHPCEWLLPQVVNILIQVVSPAELHPIIGRALRTGKGLTLWAAAACLTSLDEESRIAIVSDRLALPHCDGCEYLVRAIEEDLSFNERTFRILESCIMSSNVRVAVSAAKVAVRIAQPDDDGTLRTLLVSGYEFWLKNEKPYPKEGGAIPDSPRSILMEAMDDISPYPDPILIQRLSDSRHDVREFAWSKALERLSISDEFRDRFLAAVRGREIDARRLSLAFSAKIPFSEKQVEHVLADLREGDAQLRYASMGILESDYLSANQRDQIVRIMAHDSELEIQDRLHRITERREQSR